MRHRAANLAAGTHRVEPSATQRVELEARRRGPLGRQRRRQVAAILEQFRAGQGRTEPDLERLPVPGLAQRRRQAPRGVAQKTNPGHARQQAAFPKHQGRVQMADDGLFELRQDRPHGRLAQQERQRRRVMAEQQHAPIPGQGGQGGADLGQMRLAQGLPAGLLLRQRVGGEMREGDQRRGHPQKPPAAQIHLPEGPQPQFAHRALVAGQVHVPAVAKEALLAQFVVPHDRPPTRAKLPADLAQAFAHTRARGVIGHADEGRVAGVVAVGDGEIGGAGLGQEPVQEVVVAQRVAQPDVIAVGSQGQPSPALDNATRLVIVPAGLFGRAGIMDVAHDGDLVAAGHGARIGQKAAAGKESSAATEAAGLCRRRMSLPRPLVISPLTLTSGYPPPIQLAAAGCRSRSRCPYKSLRSLQTKAPTAAKAGR